MQNGNGIGIDINAIGAMPTPTPMGTHAQPAEAAAPTPFEMPQVGVQPVSVQPAVVVAPTPFEMPQVGAINNTITSSAPLEAPSTMVMNAAPGVIPIMNTNIGNLVATALTPEQQQVVEAQSAPAVYATPVGVPVVEQTPVVDVSNITVSIDMAGLGLESTVVHTTVLPTPAQEIEQTVTQPLSVVEENGLISRMSAAQYDNFIKILDSINSDTNALVNNISNGVITLSREGGILTTKINHIFGDKSWIFNNPGVQLKRLKLAKSEGETIIMNDGNSDILVAKKKTGETSNIVKLSQIDSDFLPQSLAKDYGEKKYSCLLEKEQVRKLVDARASYEKTTYHITIDKNSNEIVKLHLGDDYAYSLLTEASRELKTYTVTQLFPIVEEAYISLYINDRDEVSFKTSVDVYNATISFHIGADEYIKSIVANLQI